MAEFTPFSDRDTFNEAEALALQERGALVVDPRRSRPLWFDGRFLTARDLLREQNYFLTRQKDVGRATGRGVIEGLATSAIQEVGSSLTKVAITAGHGIAFDGNHVILPEDIEVDLSEIAIADTVNVRLGLSERPAPSLRNMSGLFVLSLRPVEYTANPVASYPTSLDGERGLHSSDIVEAVAVTLTPFSLFDAPIESSQTRAYAAKQIFLDQSEMGLPGFALPLALLSLDQGRVDWLDEPLVRRELPALARDTLGLGLSQDALRLAHFQHYADALEETVAGYEDAGSAPRFAASDHFRALPAAGRLPSACIDPGGATQSFFPAEMEVDLSLIPEDELPALIEESFAYPPIDLTRAPEEQENVSILILAPVLRSRLQEEIGALRPLMRQVRPATLFGYGHVKPLERIKTFRLSLRDLEAASQPPDLSVSESAWSQLVRRNPYLWYLRRRSLSRHMELESVLVPIGVIEDPDEPQEPEGPQDPGETLEERIEKLLKDLGELGAVAELAETEFTRLKPNSQITLLDFMESDLAREKTVAAIAALKRSETLVGGSQQDLPNLLQPLRDASARGYDLVAGALLPGLPRDVTEKELALQAPMAVSANFTAFLDRLAAMPSSTQKKTLETLKTLLEKGDPATIDQFLAGDAKQTEPGAPKSEAFLSLVQQPTTRSSLEQALKSASAAGRDVVFTTLTEAGAERSRLALAGVTRLAVSTKLTATNAASQLKNFNPPFVEGLAKVETRLLDKVKPGVDDSAQDQKRIVLLVNSQSLPPLSEIGQALGVSSKKLIDFANTLRGLLDSQKVTLAAVTEQVQAAHKELVP